MRRKMKILKMIAAMVMATYVAISWSFSLVIVNMISYMHGKGLSVEAVAADLWVLVGGILIIQLAKQYCISLLIEARMEQAREEALAEFVKRAEAFKAFTENKDKKEE